MSWLAVSKNVGGYLKTEEYKMLIVHMKHVFEVLRITPYFVSF
jgi:hypothetical protein